MLAQAAPDLVGVHKVARAHGFSVSEWRVMATLAGREASASPPGAGGCDEAADVHRMLDR